MNNPVQFVKNMRNPEPIMRQIMNSPQYQNNQFKREMADNAMDMRSKNDVQGLTDLARSVCKEKGIDFDALYSQLKQNR